MAELITEIWMPGEESTGTGLGDWGNKTRGEMIAKYREYAQRNLEVAQRVLATPDSDFIVEGRRGRTKLFRREHTDDLR